MCYRVQSQPMRVSAESVTALLNLLVAVQGVVLLFYFGTRRNISGLACFNIALLVLSLLLFPLNAAVVLSYLAQGDTMLQ